MNAYDEEYYSSISHYLSEIDKIYIAMIAELAAIVADVYIPTDELFSFSRYPGVRKKIDRMIQESGSKIILRVQSGVNASWGISNRKNDAFVESVFKNRVIKIPQMYTRRNAECLHAFQKRKVNGIRLSDRVWKYTENLKPQLELAIDVAVTEGMSAADLSKNIRQLLKEPDKLYRKIRDKHGNLVLSKAAKDYHPGRGVYRSSYQNAMRLARHEINKAYRESDWIRWQQMDFVIGYDILPTKRTSGACNLCETLKGRYPKGFKFTGWHVGCLCTATPVVCSDSDFNRIEQSILKGEHPAKARSIDMPDKFTLWYNGSKHKLNPKRLPDWYSDNEKILKNIAA